MAASDTARPATGISGAPASHERLVLANSSKHNSLEALQAQYLPPDTAVTIAKLAFPEVATMTRKPRGRRAAYLARQRLAAARLADAAIAKATACLHVVYVDEHQDGDNTFWSVNFFDGENGSQSQPFFDRGRACNEARRLAAQFGARFRA